MTTRQPRRLEPENRAEILDAALGVLRRGGLVIVPTETVYGVGCRADRPAAVAALRRLKRMRTKKPFTLHVGSQGRAFELGRPSPQAQRLARAYWPGPLTMVLEARPAGEPYRQTADGTLGIRVVAHDFTRELCARCEAPLFLSSCNRPGEPPPTTIEEAVSAFGSDSELMVDDGACPLGAPSSVVRLGRDGSVELLREGALDESKILARAATLILFVCSGNTCRSPMAEVLAREKWARQLDTRPSDLVRKGIVVTSAGVGAFPGLPASDLAIQALDELGLDLTRHRSRVLEPALVARAGRTFCMSPSHLVAVDAMLDAVGGPLDDSAHPPELLVQGEGISDPFGCDLPTYREIRDRIAECLPDVPT